MWFLANNTHLTFISVSSFLPCLLSHSCYLPSPSLTLICSPLFAAHRMVGLLSMWQQGMALFMWSESWWKSAMLTISVPNR